MLIVAIIVIYFVVISEQYVAEPPSYSIRHRRVLQFYQKWTFADCLR